MKTRSASLLDEAPLSSPPGQAVGQESRDTRSVVNRCERRERKALKCSGATNSGKSTSPTTEPRERSMRHATTLPVPERTGIRGAVPLAMADILTGGQVIFRVARGYHTREVETFGAPLLDQEVNRELFEEGVDIPVQGVRGQRFSQKAWEQIPCD